MPRMLYLCCYGTAPAPEGKGRVAMYEVTDLAGDRVEQGIGDQVFDNVADAVHQAYDLGRAAIERLETQTAIP